MTFEPGCRNNWHIHHADKGLEYARSHGAITRNDAIELLEVSTSTASRVIRKMVKSSL